MTPCDAIAGQLGALFSCVQHEKYIKVRTPFLYPDGDVVDLFLDIKGSQIVVTDLGESLRWLRNQTLTMKRSARQKQLIEDIKLTNDVELYKGMLIARTDSAGLADAVMRVGQSAVRVGDIWFTLRTRTVESTTDEVADYLKENSFTFQRSEKFHGRSRKEWTVDFNVVVDSKSSLVNVLSAGSRPSAKVSVEHAYTMWADLKGAVQGSTRLVSLVDDAADVWTDEEIALLSDVSSVHFWMKPEIFAASLRSQVSV